MTNLPNGESIMEYQIGPALDPRADDQRIIGEQAAIDAAVALSAKDDSVPIAVWNCAGEIEHLFLRGQQFKAV
jgi:hypothetical protein